MVLFRNYLVLYFLSCKKKVGLLLCLPFACNSLYSQCPANIDFESGSFNNWTCLIGSVASIGSQNVISLSPSGGPVEDRHTMLPATPGQLDYFGGFPVACPNGSGYSVKLGNNSGGAQAEGISYQFTIPADKNTYSLTYHYAVVFQDPAHEIHQQPSLQIEAKNVSDNETIYCSSFSFFPNGSALPGFNLSPIQQDTTNVYTKNWTPVTINLNGKAGKTIQLIFKTSDCTFRKHFGYAYIDVNTNCDSEFEGAAFCSDDTIVTVTAPYGYLNYNWYNQNFSTLLGTQQNLVFTPPPASGTTVAVEVTPYFGYGCVDTFYTKLMDTLTIRPNAGADTYNCNGRGVQIGENPKPTLVYSWSPATGLSNPNIANPRAAPTINTTYTLTVRSGGGGCATTDNVFVEAFNIDTSLQLIGKNLFCKVSRDSAILIANTTGTVQWYKDNNIIVGATQKIYRVLESGTYYAIISNNKGCTEQTGSKTVVIELPIAGIRYPIVNAVKNLPMPLEARSIGITAKWTPATYLNFPNSYTPTFISTRDTLYTIKLTTEANCITIDTQQVRIFAFLEIYVPTAFTPNNDGVNDYILPIAPGFKKINYFKIFNRWGKEVFDLKQNEKGWNGIYKGVAQPVETYVWMIEGLGIDNKVAQRKGTCVLIR